MSQPTTTAPTLTALSSCLCRAPRQPSSRLQRLSPSTITSNLEFESSVQFIVPPGLPWPRFRSSYMCSLCPLLPRVCLVPHSDRLPPLHHPDKPCWTIADALITA
eukprot:784986-Pleurochrysis_carterae.AAC.2